MGTVVALLSAPLVAYSWPVVFYAAGVNGFLWTLFALKFSANDPESHKTISTSEKTYITATREGSSEPTLAFSRDAGPEPFPHWTQLFLRKVSAYIGFVFMLSDISPSHSSPSLRRTFATIGAGMSFLGGSQRTLRTEACHKAMWATMLLRRMFA